MNKGIMSKININKHIKKSDENEIFQCLQKAQSHKDTIVLKQQQQRTSRQINVINQHLTQTKQRNVIKSPEICFELAQYSLEQMNKYFCQNNNNNKITRQNSHETYNNSIKSKKAFRNSKTMFRNYSQVIKISHTDRACLYQNVCDESNKNIQNIKNIAKDYKQKYVVFENSKLKTVLDFEEDQKQNLNQKELFKDNLRKCSENDIVMEKILFQKDRNTKQGIKQQKRQEQNLSIDYIKSKKNVKFSNLIQQQKQNISIRNIKQKHQHKQKPNNTLKHSNFTLQNNKTNKINAENKPIHQRILSANRPIYQNYTLPQNILSKLLQSQSFNNSIFTHPPSLNPNPSIQRKKYTQLKNKLSYLLSTIQQTENINFSQIFQYQQIILKDFLNTYVNEIKKQCVQKGEFIQIIWNCFFQLMNKVIRMLVQKSKSSERQQVKNSLILHESYQELYKNAVNKIKQLGQKYNQAKNVIDRLVVDLRYNRKQIRKIYKNLAVCNQKLNQYKQDYLELTHHHIDLLIESKNVTKQAAVQFVEKQEQINRAKNQKIKIKVNKEKLREQIIKEIQQQKIDSQQQQQVKQQFITKINNQIEKSLTLGKEYQYNHKQSQAILQQFIQKYSSKCIGPKVQLQVKQDVYFMNRNIGKNISTDTHDLRGQLKQTQVQVSFWDKLDYEIVNNIGTQTMGGNKTGIVWEDKGIQADGDEMRINMVKRRIRVENVIQMAFYFDIEGRDKKMWVEIGYG